MLKTLEKKIINLKISSSMSQYLLNYKYEFIKSKKIGDNVVKITVDNSFELNKFYIIAENNIKKNEDEGGIEKLNKSNNKKLNTKKYKEKNTIKKLDITEEGNKKTVKKNKTKKALKKPSSKNKELETKEKVNKKTAEKKKKIKEVKTGWWDQ
jgi:hypothetical protein